MEALLVRHRRVLLVLLVATVCGIGANAVRRASKGSSSAYDDTVLFSRELVFEQEDVYRIHGTQGTHTKYPPFFFVFMAPFAALPIGFGSAVFFLVNLALAAGAIVLAVRAVWPEDAPRGPPWPALAVVGALNALLIVTNLSRGQVNILIVFFVVAALYLALRARDDLAGLALAVAFMLKLTPVLLLVYFVWKGRWKTLRGFGVGVIACFALQQLVLGPARGIEVTQSWIEVLGAFSQGGVLAEGDPMGIRHTNQSLAAALFRLLTDRPADGQAFFVNVLALGDATVQGIVRGFSIAILLVGAWLTRVRRAGTSSLRFAMEASLVLIAMLLISPISWSNHYVALIFPWAAAVEGLRRMPADAPARRRITLWMLVAFALGLGAVWPLLLAFSVQTIGAVALAGALVLLLRHLDVQPTPDAA